MIAPPDSTASTMLVALSTTIGALNAAVELDVDRTPDDREFFAVEREALKPFFDTLFAAEREATSYSLLVVQAKQARVQLGDTILDRGVSRAKARMKVELKGSAMEEGADHVFGTDVSDIIQAERAKEPGLVLQAVGKFAQVPSFPGKAEMEADLKGRATRQQQNFVDRDAAAVKAASLTSAVKVAVAAGSDALYKLEKRLLDRFPRQTQYVKAFFYDAAPSRKKAEPPTNT
ncbi:hypothetical protein KEG38_33135 [Polyangium jinanense]|uniref:hypothetical protein n=1 Tax=Polyangium jinanense TaxID=2829994 RepID=UPI00233FBB5D|nr:hypothetical protein [Polyangium jinanense]MDC3958747.1 hypothetical protein [Polyangium jinanense]